MIGGLGTGGVADRVALQHLEPPIPRHGHRSLEHESGDSVTSIGRATAKQTIEQTESSSPRLCDGNSERAVALHHPAGWSPE